MTITNKMKFLLTKESPEAGEIWKSSDNKATYVLLEKFGRQDCFVAVTCDEEFTLHFVHDIIMPPAAFVSEKNRMFRLWNRRLVKSENLKRCVDRVDQKFLDEINQSGEFYQERVGKIFPPADVQEYRNFFLEKFNSTSERY